MQRKIFVVRHGEIVRDEKKRFIGQIDLPLSENGRREAAFLRDQLAGTEINGIFSSDLDRSMSTTRIICTKQTVKPVAIKELREVSLGQWEGLTFEEVKSKYPVEYSKRNSDVFNYQHPNGESFAQCAVRVLSILTEIQKCVAGNVLIVGHAGVNRIIICHMLGIPYEELFKIPQNYGCLNIFSIGNYGIKLIALNDVHKQGDETLVFFPQVKA